MRNAFYFLFFVLLSLPQACSPKKSEEPKNEQERLVYMIGQMQATRLDHLNLSEKELEIFAKGFKDQALKKEMPFHFTDYGPNIQAFITSRIEEVARSQDELGKKHIEAFKNDGGKILGSGLAYKIIKQGNELRAGPDDSVEVHYHGTLVDGRVFDSSIDRGDKGVFPLVGVIKGWQEGLSLIGEGGEIQIWVPADLAYGTMGSPPLVKGGTTLGFYLKLFRVIKNGSKE